VEQIDQYISMFVQFLLKLFYYVKLLDYVRLLDKIFYVRLLLSMVLYWLLRLC